MKAIDLIQIMEKWAKPSLIDDWDNTGFQIGNSQKDVKKVLIALDLDRKVLDIALKNSYDMIITHHPIIFRPLKNITSEDEKGKMILDIIKNDIVVYNAHSNLDMADRGVSHRLADVLGLMDKCILRIMTTEGEKDYGYGIVGNIEDILLSKYLCIVKERLKADNIMVYGDTDIEINRVAVCGGSGGEFIYDAYASGADMYITGDIKYHDAQLGYELGLVIVDGGHFNTEKMILPDIKKELENNIEEKIDIEVIMESSLPMILY